MPGRLLGLVSRGSFSSSDIKAPLKDHSSRNSAASIKAAIIDPKRNSMDHIKIPGLGKHSHSEKKQQGVSPKQEASRACKLDIVVESPPLVSYNSPANSSGALFSAQLKLQVLENNIKIEKFELQLLCSVSVKKPVQQHCSECTTKTTELKKWNFAPEVLPVSKGEHRFPFSYLFPGHLPATTHAHLAQLDYHLSAVAKLSNGETITFGRPVNLLRAILPGNDKHSIRIFPPTNLTATVQINPIIYPIGTSPVYLRLTGISTKNKDSIVRWRVRKMNWRIEETQKMISPACSKHAVKVGGAGKGIQHEEMRIIGDHEIDQKETPWKTNFDAGEVEIEFPISVNPALKPNCDVAAPNGLSIVHNLVVEMVVAEEWAPIKRPSQMTPTGAARILRMQFHLHLTQRAGLGISWDEEQPPVYEDVPESPPAYSGSKEVELTEIEGQIEDFHLGAPLQGPPVYASSSSAVRPSSGNSNQSFASPRVLAATNAANAASGANGAAQVASPRIVPAQSMSPAFRPAAQRQRFTVDDFLSEPNLPERPASEPEEEQIDQASGTVL